MFLKIKIFLIKWHLGKLKKKCRDIKFVIFLFVHSDDEGSDEDEDEDVNENESDNDEDYHEVEEEQQQPQEENESPSIFFGTNLNQQQNGFQFGVSTSKPETVSGLSSMMAKFDFNVNSPFNFGSQPTIEVIYINCFNFLFL